MLDIAEIKVDVDAHLWSAIRIPETRFKKILGEKGQHVIFIERQTPQAC
jgi:hypothetical protein